MQRVVFCRIMRRRARSMVRSDKVILGCSAFERHDRCARSSVPRVELREYKDLRFECRARPHISYSQLAS